MANKIYSEIQNCLERLNDHILECVTDEEKIKAYYIKIPGTRMMSTLILFTPEGIALMGDLTPTIHGTVSCLGYGLNWFAGELSPGYLAEKFLQQGWVPELAAETLQEELDNGPEQFGEKCFKKIEPKELENKEVESEDEWEEPKPEWDEECKKDLEEIIAACENGCTVYEFCEKLENLEWYFMDDGVPGYGYNPNEMAWLCAIQQTFARLYHKSLTEEFFEEPEPVL